MTNRRYRRKGVVGKVARAKYQNQIECIGESRAPVPGYRAGVRLCEDALAWLVSACASKFRNLCVEELGHQATAAVRRGIGQTNLVRRSQVEVDLASEDKRRVSAR